MNTNQNLSWLRSELSKRGIKPSKQHGQNFLIDGNILRFIIDTALLNKNDIILEIGTGPGALTELMADATKAVVSVEIDPRLYEFATDNLALKDNVLLINKDVMQDKSHINPEIISIIQNLLKQTSKPESNGEANHHTFKLVSNLPYHISTPVIINVLESGLPVELIVVMLQKEITNRIFARPGTKDYGILSIIAQYFTEVEVVKSLSPNVFWPSPKVDSAIVKMSILKDEQRIPLLNYELFIKIVKAIFSSRRKTINNSLMRLDIVPELQKPMTTILDAVNIPKTVRGETLTVKQIIGLANELFRALKS